MSLMLADATALVDRHLAQRPADGYAVRRVGDATEEFDVGWVFYYQSEAFLETGDLEHQLGGNAPLFVARSDGRLFVLDYHRPLVESLATFRACGDPNAEATGAVHLVGWRAGAATVDAIKRIRQHSKLGLGDALGIINACMAGEPTVVAATSPGEARALVQALDLAGFEARIDYRPRASSG